VCVCVFVFRSKRLCAACQAADDEAAADDNADLTEASQG